MRPKKVLLLVDDSDQMLAVRRFLLETRGYKVLSASSGEQALELFRQGGIDLVLSDLVMPNMDGNQLIREMKQIDPEVPMIIFSGHVKSFGRGSQADAFLPKGFCSPVEMLEQIRLKISRKRGPRRGYTPAPRAAMVAVEVVA